MKGLEYTQEQCDAKTDAQMLKHSSGNSEPFQYLGGGGGISTRTLGDCVNYTWMCPEPLGAILSLNLIDHHCFYWLQCKLRV